MIRGVTSDLVRAEFEGTQLAVIGNVTCLQTESAGQAMPAGLIRRGESLRLVLLEPGWFRQRICRSLPPTA
jgi:hypothetical protein